MAGTNQGLPPRSIWRRIERRFVGLWMSALVWIAERKLKKATKKARG
jgi:hypothetical protein